MMYQKYIVQPSKPKVLETIKNLNTTHNTSKCCQEVESLEIQSFQKVLLATRKV